MSANPIHTAEPSYFNFVMTRRGFRRTAVPFAQAAGMLPELTRDYRAPRTSGFLAH
jgi:hypothetical protein